MGNGDGTFGPPVPYTVMPPAAGNDVGVFGLAVVGFDSTVSGSTPPAGAPEVVGTPGLYVTAQARNGSSPGERLLPARRSSTARAISPASARPECRRPSTTAGKIAAFDDDGHTDLVATDTGGVRVIYGVPGRRPAGRAALR